jgi:hypothetical protein
VKFSDSASATDIEQSVVLLDASIKKQFLNVRRVFVEAEALQSRPLGD